MFWISANLSFYPYFTTARGNWVMVIHDSHHYLVLSHEPSADVVILVELDASKIRPEDNEAGMNRYIYEDSPLRVGGPGGSKFTLVAKEELQGQFEPISA